MNKRQCAIHVLHKICNEEMIYLKYHQAETNYSSLSKSTNPVHWIVLISDIYQ